MPRITAVICLFIVLAGNPQTHADPWNASVDANITMTQNAYTDNWAGSERGSMTWTFLSNSLAEKQITDLVNVKNTLKLQFGQNHTQEQETSNWGKPVKSSDLIDFESVFRFSLGGFVDPYAAGRIESQFIDKSDPAKNRMFNPLTFTESAGVAKVLIKTDTRDWTARFGAGFREHVNRDVPDPAGGGRDTEVSTDGGFIFVNDFKTPLAGDQILLTSKLTVFQGVYYSKADDFRGTPREDDWKSPDIEWENIFTAKITKYLDVNLYTLFLYDKEIDKAGRFKQTLSLGLSYKLL